MYPILAVGMSPTVAIINQLFANLTNSSIAIYHIAIISHLFALRQSALCSESFKVEFVFITHNIIDNLHVSAYNWTIIKKNEMQNV